MALPALSIVVVNWNTRELLLRLLAQLAPSAAAATEVIVVDNASSDGSADAAERAFPGARLVRAPENGGFAYGVNRGIAAARGEWILLLNTDTDVDRAELDRFVAEAAAVPAGGVFGPRIVDEHGAVQSSTWRRHGLWRPLLDALGFARLLDGAAPPQGTAEVDCVSGCVFLIRRAALEQTGALDERFFMYFEEADLCARVRAAGFGVFHLPATAFVHAGGLSATQAAERTFLAFRESCLLYHARWHGRLGTEWVRACLLLGTALRWTAMALLGRAARRRLHGAALRRLLRPGLVRELCARPRRVPAVAARPRA
ncbi:MAG: glycosyltransferase family 2 protein [Planctomycetota bacterium]